MSDDPWIKLREEFELRRLEFVRTEIQTGQTFLAHARTQLRLGNPQRATQSLEKAMEATQVAKKRLMTMSQDRECEETRQLLGDCERLTDEIESCVAN